MNATKADVVDRARESLTKIVAELEEMFDKFDSICDHEPSQKMVDELMQADDKELYERTAYCIFNHLIEKTGADPCRWVEIFFYNRLGIRVKVHLISKDLENIISHDLEKLLKIMRRK